MKKASLQADIDGKSVRHQLKYTANLIQSGGGSIDQIKLSRTSLDRFRKEARHEKVASIKTNEKQTCSFQRRQKVDALMGW